MRNLQKEILHIDVLIRSGVTSHHLNFFYDIFAELWDMLIVDNMEKLERGIPQTFSPIICQLSRGPGHEISSTEYMSWLLLLFLNVNHWNQSRRAAYLEGILRITVQFTKNNITHWGLA